jgi:hypothetical protein
MTPEERERADALAATGFQLAADLIDARVWGEAARAEKIHTELSLVCEELVPLLVQYEAERQAWVRRLPHGH